MTADVHEAVTTVLQVHHPRARERGRDVLLAAQVLTAGQLVSCLPVLEAWEAFSRRLTHQMDEEEAQLLDRVQSFVAREQLRPGALHASRAAFDGLFDAHAEQRALAAAVRSALAAQRRVAAEERALAVAVMASLSAFDAHVAFESSTLRAALAPYVEVR